MCRLILSARGDARPAPRWADVDVRVSGLRWQDVTRSAGKSGEMHEEGFVTTVIMVVALLFVASVSAVVAHRIRFPYTIGLVVVGMLVAFAADVVPGAAHALEAFQLQPVMIMFLFIPILIFESAYSMDVAVLRRNLVPVLVLAAPGLLLSTALIGLAIWALTPLPFESALIFGCLISATDPVAVIALFKEVGAPKRLTILMEGESVFNDATAIVTFQIILAVIATGILDVQTVTGGVLDFVTVFAGGLLVGWVIGWLVVQAIPLVGDQPLVHITLSLVAAYGAFIIADHYLATSGVMAILAAGMTIGYYAPTRHRERVHEYLEMFWEDAAFVANSMIFLMLGLSEKTFLSNAGANPAGLLLPVLVAILIVLVVRFAVVFSLVPLLNVVLTSPPMSRAYQVVLAWGGLRGAIAIALAISLPEDFPYRWQIIDFTLGVTLFSLLVNGTSMKWVMKVLGVSDPSPSERFLEAYGRLDAERAAQAAILDDKVVPEADQASRDALADKIKERIFQAENALIDARAALSTERSARHDLFWTGCFAIERRVWIGREQEGLLRTSARQALGDALEIPRERHHRMPGDANRPREPLAAKLWRRLWPGTANRRAARQAELASAILAAANEVLADIDELARATGADREDVGLARVFYTVRAARARADFDTACKGHEGARARIAERMLEERASGARADRLALLEAHGALPGAIVRRLRKGLDHEAGG